MGVQMAFKESMRARYGKNAPTWYEVQEDVRRRWRAYWWCISERRDRSWFYKDGEIPEWVPSNAMQQD